MNRIGFAFGMVVGAVTGLLLAPRRGAETRRRIRDVGSELADLAITPFQELAVAAVSRRAARAGDAGFRGICEPTL